MNRNDIAIIGYSSRFVGAKNNDEYWQNLKNGVDSIAESKVVRWRDLSHIDSEWFVSQDADFDINAYFLKDLNINSWLLEDVDKFDPSFFGISDTMARSMDPQQRLTLEQVAEAITHSGYTFDEVNGKKVGTFIGAQKGSYIDNIRRIRPIKLKGAPLPVRNNENSLDNRNIFIGTIPNIIAANISKQFNLHGPSYVISSASSSSILAIHLACQSLAAGECKMAIAGGVQLILSAIPIIGLNSTGVLSKSRKCSSFSKSADGYILSEGIGICVLKPLYNAVEDGDTICAIIKGSSINNDGKTMTILMPNSRTQTDVIAEALQKTKINARTISYLEANGTASRIGDFIEIKSSNSAFRKFTKQKGYCAIGTVSSNIGHTGHAAGIAGLIKVLLSLKNKQIPPLINVRDTNPAIDFDETPFYINKKPKEWKVRYGVRRAGLNSFGFGGTNCHMIIEEFNRQKYPKYKPIRSPLPPIQFNRKSFWNTDISQ